MAVERWLSRPVSVQARLKIGADPTGEKSERDACTQFGELNFCCTAPIINNRLEINEQNRREDMARPRVIEQSDILDAAERVVIRDGAAQLTLDAVAAEAGISKASVIYDYKSKKQLVNAAIKRRLDAESQRIAASTASLGSAPSAAINGLIAAAAEPIRDEVRAVAVNLVAALAEDAEARGYVEDAYGRMIASVTETAAHPRGAILAFLALEGLKRLELHNLHSWSDEQRADILRDIRWLVDAEHLHSRSASEPADG